MLSFETQHFGNIEFDDASVVVFPAGLPGFEERRRFLALHFPESAPLVYLQSLEDGELCFVALPVRAVDAEYRLCIGEEDLEILGLEGGRQPVIGSDVLALAVVSIRESGLSANLLAPVVVNLNNRLAVQAIAPDSSYSHQYRLTAEKAVVCS
jgi:flagellar assembly factor FliW